MEILAMPPVWSQSGSELLSALDTLKAAAALLRTYELQIIGRLEEMGTAQELGARDTSELISERYRLDRSEVRKELAFAAALRKYPAVAAALPDPTDPLRPATISSDQAKVIVTTLEKAPSSVPVETLTVAEEQLIEAARITSPRELTRFAHKVLATLDTDGPEPAEDEARRKEFLRLRRVDGGVKFTGFLAADSGEQLETQLHHLSKPHKTIDGERDPRSPDQRCADALKVIMDRAAGNPDHPGVPHLTVTIDFNDLTNALSSATGFTSNGNPAAALNPGPGPAAGPGGGASGAGADADRGLDAGAGAGGGSRAVGELVFGGNLSAAAVRLMACDAAVLPIVLGGDSQPLDVGTEQRFVNRYLRRALNKRDKGCVICKAPPWMCHAHHLTHWADGGPTSLHNLALLCALHHRAVHTGQWTLTITQGVVHVTRPTWADPSPTDPATLAKLITWNTPARNAGASHTNSTNATTTVSTTATTRASASADASTCASADASASADVSASADADAGASRAGVGRFSASRRSVGSDPTHEQPGRLPAASTLLNPTLAAAREALRARLTSLVPHHSDPWATDATPAAGP